MPFLEVNFDEWSSLSPTNLRIHAWMVWEKLSFRDVLFDTISQKWTNHQYLGFLIWRSWIRILLSAINFLVWRHSRSPNYFLENGLILTNSKELEKGECKTESHDRASTKLCPCVLKSVAEKRDYPNAETGLVLARPFTRFTNDWRKIGCHVLRKPIRPSIHNGP